MFKKRDIIIILSLFLVISAVIVFWIYNREYFTIGGSKANFDKKNMAIFASLPEGSDEIQKISFNFPYKNNSIYIKKISSGSKLIENPVEEKLLNNSNFNFGDYISHSKIIIKSGDLNIEYDLWVTTGKIPVICINTKEVIPDEAKVDCKISIFSADSIEMNNDIAAEIELIDVSKSIPKSSYSINIKEEAVSSDIPDILDFENTKRFHLSASYMDRSFLRERLSYEIFKSLSDDNIAPNGRYIEVFENDSYKGFYILYERADKNMFSITNYDKKEDTHSVIYETINWKADFTRNTEGFSQIEPDTEKDGPYFEPLLGLEDIIINAGKEHFLENITNIADIRNILDNHILFLLSGCTDEMASNNYIYRGNAKNDKFKFSPGNLYLSGFGRDYSSEKIDSKAVSYGTRLFNRLYEDEKYREMLKERWNDLRKDKLTVENMSGLIDENIDGRHDAINRNFSRWAITINVYKDDYSSDQDIDYIKKFIKDRIAWLDNYINSPPLIKIGDNYAKIDEETKTIFCSLPDGADTTQRVSWYFSPDSEIYLDRLPVSSSPLGQYLNQKSKSDDYGNYTGLIGKGSKTDDITIFLDRPAENESVDGNLQIVGWALNEKLNQDIGVDNILLFDGPVMSRDKFLGAAALKLPRLDVEKYFNNPSYRGSGFEIYVYTLCLKNGLHELYLYAFDKYGNYTLNKIKIEVKNDENLINKLKNDEKNLNQKLINNKEYDFFEYIFNGKLTVKEDNREKEYNLIITTSDIPVVNIFTGNKTILNNEKTEADMQIMYYDPDEKNFINGIVFDFYGKIGIETRGKTSLNFPKKQYSIELRDDNNEDKAASLLGMPSESDWILGAPYTDKTLIRNVLAFQLSNEMGMYAPRTEFVEVFFHSSDGSKSLLDYYGLCYLAEKIKRDKNRVDVEKLDSDEDALLGGGYILEIAAESKLEPQDSIIETDIGLKLVNIYPNEDSITSKQKYWITDYMNKFERALFSDYFDDEESGYRKYIDVDSFIDYTIINELFKNAEAYRNSTFLYKERDGKLKAGPVWDFDLSSGNTVELPSIDNEPVDFIHISGKWKTGLFKDEYFIARYKDRWKQLRRNVLSDENITGIIESNYELLSEAQIRNFNRWDILGKYVWPNPEPYSKTYKEEIEKLKEWFLTRVEWIDNSIDSIHPKDGQKVLGNG